MDESLAFRLYTDQDCHFFHDAVTRGLTSKKWAETASDEDLDEEKDGQADE
jgi:hypothetical protein